MKKDLNYKRYHIEVKLIEKYVVEADSKEDELEQE